MIRHKNNLEGQLNLFDTPELSSSRQGFSLPKLEEYMPELKLAMEKEVTGLYVSGHPLAQYRSMAEQLETVELEDLMTVDEDADLLLGDQQYHDGDIVKVLCIVTGKKTKILKRRGYMAFVNIEDTSGSMEMLVFPQTYDQYRYLIEENQVLYIEGRLTVREEEETKLVCPDGCSTTGCSGTARKVLSETIFRKSRAWMEKHRFARKPENVRDCI